MNIREQLRGTGVAIVTPFSDDESVDYSALGKLIDFIILNGVDYIVTLGTTGETPTLEKQEKLDIVNFTFDKINGRVPVVVGIGGNNTKEIVEQVRSYPLDKAIAVLSACPFYNKPSQEGIFEHYKALSAVSPKPIILYNVPGRTGRNMNVNTTLRLAEIDNIVGIKEAANDIQQAIQLLKNRSENFLVTSGDDDLVLPEMACGMDGVISVAANAFPKAFSTMVNSCIANDFPAAVKINNRMLEVYRLLFAENNPCGVKAFLAEMGIIGNYLRLPNVPLGESLHGEMKKFLQENSDL